MNRLFDFAAATLVAPPAKSTDSKPEAGRLDALERELRDATVQSKESMNSQAQGTSSGTAEQKTMQEKYDPQNKTLNYYQSVLCDYSNLLSQMQDDQSSATAAMNLSTLESKTEGSRLIADSSYGLLANQFGLQRQSEDTFKKAKKTGKLSTDNWL